MSRLRSDRSGASRWRASIARALRILAATFVLSVFGFVTATVASPHGYLELLGSSSSESVTTTDTGTPSTIDPSSLGGSTSTDAGSTPTTTASDTTTSEATTSEATTSEATTTTTAETTAISGALASADPVDLAVTKVASPEPVVTGGTLTYTVTVSNEGSGDAVNATLTDPLPAGVTFVSVDDDACSRDGNVVTCGPFDLAAENSRTFTITTTAPGTPGTITNTATANTGGDQTDSDTSNNSASAVTTVGDIDLSITKTDSPDPVSVGDRITYTLKVSNAGPGEAVGAQVEDTLPEQVTFVGASEGCTLVEGTVTCTLGDLGAEQSTTLEITVQAAAAGSAVTNTATVTAGDENIDYNPDNDSASTTTTINSRAPTGKQALVLGSSVSGGASSLEATQATSLGFAVTVVDDATWRSMTAAQFAAYQLIIVGDPTCSSLSQAVSQNAKALADAVMGRAGGNTKAGNRVLIGTDPVFHYKPGLINPAVDFAGAQSGATGLYLDFTCGDADWNGNGVPDGEEQLLPLLSIDPAPGWTQNGSPPCGGDVSLISNAAQFASLTSAYLRGWGCSVHESFPTFPTDWSALAIATDTPTKPTCGTDVDTGAARCGQAYVLIAGSGIVSTAPNLSLSPTAATNRVGTQHTVTATVTSPDGSPRSGVEVSFVVTGANAGAEGTCSPTDCKTDSSGKVTFTYTGAKLGDDTINAAITVEGSRQTATAAKTWSETAPPPPPPPPGPSPSPSPSSGGGGTVSTLAATGKVKVSISAPTFARVNELVLITASIVNEGPGKATGVTFTNPVPDGLSFLAVSSSAGSCGLQSSAVVCSIGDLDASVALAARRVANATSSTVVMTYRATRTGSVTNTGSASSAGGSSSSSASITIGDAGSSPPPGSPGEPPVPTAGQTVGIIAAAGTILVDGAPVVGPLLVRFGQTIDTTNGILKLASIGPNGEVQTVILFGAVFKVLLGSDKVTVFQMQGGDFAGLCGTAKRSVSAVGAKPPKAKPKAKPAGKKKVIANKTVVRSLWGQGKGAFRTQGRYASATVRGTLWLTADRCDGTLTQVNEGIVDVQDLATGQHFNVAAGHSYLVRPPAG